MKTQKGSRWHPARISGRQKFLRKLDNDKQFGEKSKKSLEPIDISKENWSVGGSH